MNVHIVGRKARPVFLLAAALVPLVTLTPVRAAPDADRSDPPVIHFFSTTTVNCTPNPVTVGSPSTCTATVTVTPESGTGTSPFVGVTVTFASNGSGSFVKANTCTTSSSGSCSIAYVPNAAGLQTITASVGIIFNGTEFVSPSSGSTTLTVNAVLPTNPDKCKKGGYHNFTDPATAQPFRNQGQCVSFVEHRKH